MLILRLPAAILCACLSLAYVAGCGDSRPPGRSEGATRIVATTPMLGDLARRVAGEHAEVIALMGPGVDPHLFRPTRSDVQRIVAADLILANGLLLEGRLQESFRRASEAGRTVVQVGDALPVGELLHPDGVEGHPDPHVWMDPVLWSQCGVELAERLATRDPGHAEHYRAGAAAFAADADALHRRIETAMATVPPERRTLVSAHDAFGYFGRRYGIEVHGLLGISSESEAGLADLEALVALLVERRVPAVFVESTISPKAIQALVAGAKARGHDVVIGGELFSDSMGRPGTVEATWVGMLEHNARTIVEALGGRWVAEPAVEATEAHR